MIENLRKPIIIAGPCAAESMQQIESSIHEVKTREIPIMRASIVKPRTENSWDGIGIEEGIPLLRRIKEAGLIPATEVLDIEEAQRVIDGVLGQDEGNIMLWIGARNQNHRFQRNLGRLATEDRRLIVGAKNQIWSGDAERHFRGIISHICDGGGLDRSRLIMIHRGFSDTNTKGYRNTPDYNMALKIKYEEGVIMLLDPSHIGGTIEKVIEVTQEGMTLERQGVIFDGLMIEIHPNRDTAKTDSKQQLTWREYDEYIEPLVRGGTIYETKSAAD